MTIHPSAVLRARDDDRKDAFAGFRDDLAQAFAWLAELQQRVVVATVPTALGG